MRSSSSRSWKCVVAVLFFFLASSSLSDEVRKGKAKGIVCKESTTASLQIVPKFPLDYPNEAIHRFFDSSPVSASGQYLAFTQIPMQGSGNAAVVLANLHHNNLSEPGAIEIIANTTAWGAQVGAHAQWAGNHLFFNVQGGNAFRKAFGMRYDPATQSLVQLPCPVYHVSPDGAFTASPNLYKIHFTQRGYGIDHGFAPMGRLDASHDGVFLNDLSQGTCRLLYSLRSIADAIGIPSAQTRLYGFHTKWSSDSRWILFVLRTLEKPAPLADRLLTAKRVRVQHLVLLSPSGDRIKYILSWASKPFLTVDGRTVQLLDGNHPNWVPRSSTISMNLARQVSGDWQTVLLDVDQLPEHLPLYHQQLYWSPLAVSPAWTAAGAAGQASRSSSVIVRVAWERGAGHPSFHREGRLFVTDLYEKEKGEGLCAAGPTPDLPVLLVDSMQQDANHQVTVLARIERQDKVGERSGEEEAAARRAWGRRQDRSRRCDLHPAWTLDDKAVVVNVCTPAGRQVAIVRIG